MTLALCSSTRPDTIQSDLPPLSPRSSDSPVINTPAHAKSPSPSHLHLAGTAKQLDFAPSLFDYQPSSPSVSNTRLPRNRVPSTPPNKHRHSSSLSYQPLTPSPSSFSLNSRSTSRLLFPISSPVSPQVGARSQRFKALPQSSLRLPFSPRARATLAMSVQVHSAILDSPTKHYHQPSPRLPQQPLLDLYIGPGRQAVGQSSRPVSPTIAMRPSSRSERLLRDTLRRAEEHERTYASSPPAFSSVFSIARRDDDDSDCDCEDLPGLLWRSSGSPGGPGEIKTISPSKPARRKSQDAKSIHSITSPTSSRRSTLQRSPTSPSSAQNRGEEQVVTPHDAVLRSRLEGVLNQVRDQNRNAECRSVSRSRTHTRQSSDYCPSASSSPIMMHSQQLSPSKQQQQTPAGIPTPPLTPSSASTSLRGSPSHQSNSQLTPPSPSFNARTASVVCRQIDGYVSFANVEGLGAPPETDDDIDEDPGHRGNWLKWFGLKPTTLASAFETSARA